MKMKEEDKKNKQKQSSIMDMFSGSRSGRRGGRKRNRNQMDSQSRAQSSTSSVSSSTSNRASNTNIKRPRLIPQKLVFVDNNNTIIDIQDGDMTQVNWCEGIVPDCLVHHPDELDFNNIQQYIPQTTAKQIQVFDNKVHHLKCQKILVDPDPQCKDVNRCCFALHKDTLLERLINKGFIWKGKVNGPHNEDLSEYGKGQKLSIQRNRMVTYRAQLQEKERKFNNSLCLSGECERIVVTTDAKKGVVKAFSTCPLYAPYSYGPALSKSASNPVTNVPIKCGVSSCGQWVYAFLMDKHKETKHQQMNADSVEAVVEIDLEAIGSAWEKAKKKKLNANVNKLIEFETEENQSTNNAAHAQEKAAGKYSLQ
eukprot:450004_1